MAFGIGDLPLGIGVQRAIGPSHQTAARYRLRRKGFQNWRFQASLLGGLNLFLSSGFRFGCCRLGSLVQLRSDLVLAIPLVWLHQPELWLGHIPPGDDALQQRLLIPFSYGPDGFVPGDLGGDVNY